MGKRSRSVRLGWWVQIFGLFIFIFIFYHNLFCHVYNPESIKHESGFLSVFNQKTLYDAYKKRTKTIEVDLEEYNRMKEADPEFYREASSLQYGKVVSYFFFFLNPLLSLTRSDFLFLLNLISGRLRRCQRIRLIRW